MSFPTIGDSRSFFANFVPLLGICESNPVEGGLMKTIPENLLESYAPAMSAIEQVRPEATMKDFSQTRDLIKSIKSST